MVDVVLDWDVERQRYDELLARAGRSSLLQDWAWGEAKAQAGEGAPRRAVVSVGGSDVAVVQLLVRRMGPVVVARLNRGPVWLDDGAGTEVKGAVLRCLAASWRWWRGSVLMAAPEIPDGPQGSAIVAAAGMRRRRVPAWNSAWVDLEPPPDTLRTRLNGKWRNMLVNAERNDGVIETLSGMAAVDWLVPHYRRMMAEKGFTGVSPALLYGLCRNGRREDALLLLRLRDASAERSPVAAVLFARHGSAATYLVGWNTEAGRKVRANHLLLWQGMLELRQRGCGWLDLGGIDDVSTPGVASFKRGVKGQEYRLIGECLAV